MKTGPLPDGFFEAFLAQSFEPQCESVAAGLLDHEFYQMAKALPCWRRILHETALGYFMARFQSNRVVVPKTFEEMRIARAQLFVAGVRREGRAYPKFNAGVAWLRENGFERDAERAMNAAANFVCYPPKGETGERLLRILLPVFWLPASLWMLCDGDIQVALPLLVNREGTCCLAEWKGIGTVARQNIGRIRRSLKLPNAEGLVRVPCADIDHATGRLKIRRDAWEELARA